MLAVHIDAAELGDGSDNARSDDTALALVLRLVLTGVC